MKPCLAAGITDESKEGKWQWFTQEESSRYSNWKQDEPDNGGSTGSNYAVIDVAKAGELISMGAGSIRNQNYMYLLRLFPSKLTKFKCRLLKTQDKC